MLKRTFDLIITGLGGLVALPLFLLIAAGIKLSSRGPVLFKQTRIGRNGRPFVLYKFRSMRVRADQDGACISVRNDPRETRIGHYLRATKLDELPQLWNVIVGDMSIVGPRSERPFFVDRFNKDIPGYSQRFRVKAGITGFAQVAGSYDTLPEDKLRYDLIYIKNYSILLDLRLILQTVRAVFSTSLYNRTFEANRTEFSTDGRRRRRAGKGGAP